MYAAQERSRMRYRAVAIFGCLLFTFEAVYSPALTIMATSQSSSAAKPNPDADGNYHVGDGVTAPKATFVSNPELPEEARRKRVSATVVVWVVVEQDGSTTDVHVAKSSADGLSLDLKDLAAELDKNAMEAAKRDRFQPATFQGKPVPVQIQVTCHYRP